jgi:hypothetical protein
MLRPMSVQEAPERRAWSTKWPIRWSATSEMVRGEHRAGELVERVGVHFLDRLDEVVQPDRPGDGNGLGHASTIG